MESDKKIGYYLPGRDRGNLIQNYLSNEYVSKVPYVKLKTNDQLEEEQAVFGLSLVFRVG